MGNPEMGHNTREPQVGMGEGAGYIKQSLLGDSTGDAPQGFIALTPKP